MTPHTRLGPDTAIGVCGTIDPLPNRTRSAAVVFDRPTPGNDADKKAREAVRADGAHLDLENHHAAGSEKDPEALAMKALMLASKVAIHPWFGFLLRF